MKAKILFVFFSLSNFVGMAQIPKTVDSLKVYLKKQKPDTTYVLALNEYAFLMVQEGNFEETNKTINQIESLSKKLNFGTGFYKAENMRGVVQYSQQKPEIAMKHFLKCNEIIKKYNLPKKIFQNSLNNIGIIYDQMGDRENATKYAMQLIDFQEKNHLEPLKTWPYDQIGGNLKHYKKPKEALAYYQKSLKIETDYNNLTGMAIAENNIGTINDDLNENQEAIKHYKLGLNYAEKENYKLLQTDLLTNLGLMHIKIKAYDTSENYLKKSEALCRQLNAISSLKIVCHNLGDLYFFQKNYSLSEKYYLEALEISKKLEDPEYLYSANQALAEYYEETKDFQKAYKYKVEADIAKDSTFKIETAKNTEDLLRKYETEKKEQEIELLNAKNEKSSLQNKALIAGGLLVFLLTGISVVFLINKNKLKRLEESQKLRNKIATDLHDEIGSTLSSIMLISDMAKKQEGSTQKMFTKINSDSKSVMESVDEIIWSISPMNDSLQGIILRLKEYAQPLADSKNIKFELKVEEGFDKIKLETEVRRNLYLIVKEAINNLMKHSYATEASVIFIQEKKNLCVKIIDNGKGFDNEQFTSRNGLKNMQTRASEINGKLSFESSKENGSSLSLTIPMA
ncbi:hypothetical protein EGI22_00860 [Lacihabitans sp. LS3-19]|uniref:tetratricopeptide repeat-containing sensor histidine kinase n=1 Tax=Lacihabitans sp. LS3-19 TaxID=2487335 RepID=UPI0020CCE1BC|nr:sensor histidine kinase [Lacihabitans sp. LS3-19]MCP9766436.1 hypothetical protein [Lacihabitans sp. LS3-19]